MQMFEYVIVLISIVIGLALTHLMQGIAGLIQNPERSSNLVGSPRLGGLHVSVHCLLVVVGISAPAHQDMDLRHLSLRDFLRFLSVSYLRGAVPPRCGGI